MFKDIELSQALKSELDEPIDGVDFNIEVLTSGTWPEMEKLSLALPPQLKSCTDRF